MRQTFLRANGHDRLAVHVQIHVVAVTVPVADGAAQARDAARDRVAVRILSPGDFYQLIDDMLRRGLIRIPHAEIDDVLSPRPRLCLQLIDDIEDVGRKAFDLAEFVRRHDDRFLARPESVGKSKSLPSVFQD